MSRFAKEVRRLKEGPSTARSAPALRVQGDEGIAARSSARDQSPAYWLASDIQRAVQEAAWNSARDQSPAYRLASDIQLAVQKRAVKLISQPHGTAQLPHGQEQGSQAEAPFAQDHLQWLIAASYSLASLVLSEEEIAEANRWARWLSHGSPDRPEQWFEPPSRRALAGPTGVGKTVMACALLAEVIDRYKANGGALGAGASGLLYCAGSIALLVDAMAQLEALGADMEHVGLYYSPEEASKYNSQPIQREEIKNKVVVLCTHQQVGVCSRYEASPISSINEPTSRVTFDDLTQFRGQRRAGIWDEAFLSVDASSLPYQRFKEAHDLVRSNEADIARRIGQELSRQRIAVFQGMFKTLQAIKSGLTRSNQNTGKPVLFNFADSQLAEIAELGKPLLEIGYPRATKTIDWLAKSSRDGVSLHAIRSGDPGGELFVVKPLIRVDERLDRILILDASYRISVLSSSDATVKEVSIAAILEAEGGLQPKTFDDVTVTFCRGPAGRDGLTKDRQARAAMMRRQVKRILAHVPENEPFLAVTFVSKQPSPYSSGGSGRRSGYPPVRWEQEIRRELKAQDVPDWENRAQIITYGQHRGRNSWSHIKYGFAFGVIHRQWEGDLHLNCKVLERDLINVDSTAVADARLEGVAAEVAVDLQQLLGRLNCRNTRRVEGKKSGQSGMTKFWVELYEPGRAQPINPVDSPLVDRLRQELPGASFLVEDEPKRDSELIDRRKQRSSNSLEQQFADAAGAWLGQLGPEVLRVSSNRITAAVKAALPEVVDRATDKTLQRGIARAKAVVLVTGEWTVVSSRSWVRTTATPAPDPGKA